MAQKIDGFTLPNYANNGFQEMLRPNYSKNYSLSGKLHVDFDANIRRGWIIKFDVITEAEYQSLRTKFDKQFTDKVFLRFEDDEMEINQDVFLALPDERNIRWNKGFVNDLVIILDPEDADSLS